MAEPPKPIHHPMAFCPKHGLFVARGAIGIAEGATNVKIDHVSIRGFCPKCGPASAVVSEAIPGRYEATSEGLNVLVDPSISAEALAAIKDIAERAQAGKISAEEAKREAERIHPKAGKLFDILNWSDQAKATLYAGIIMAAASIYAARTTSHPSVTVTPTVIERVIGEKKVDHPVELAPIKESSQRRAEVNQDRRESLRERRGALNPKPPRKPSNKKP